MNIALDFDELACLVCGKTEDEADDIINNDGVDDLLFNKYEISQDQFCEIVTDLLKFTPLVQAGLSGKVYHAFVTDNRMIVKVKA